MPSTVMEMTVTLVDFHPDLLPPVRTLWHLPVFPKIHDVATDKFQGPWFTTQLLLASTIGFTSFLMFSYGRTRWPLLFAPRTKLKGSSCVILHFENSSFLYCRIFTP